MSDLLNERTKTRAGRPALLRLGLGFCLFVVGFLLAADASAQRPFRIFDPFYRSETALRTFFDGVAFTGEFSYRAAGSVQNSGFAAPDDNPLGLSFRLDYQLAPRVDLSAIWDASGTADSTGFNIGRTIAVNWVALKYYWRVENSDYAIRLAVDPSSDGRVGFPQMDIAFLSTRALSPVFSNDMAIGVRAVRMGFRQAFPRQAESGPLLEYINTRALGLEIHFMATYNVIFDPARSNAFFSFLGEGGQYTMLETVSHAGDEAETREEARKYRGGALRIRFGIEYNKPSYQVIPFLSVPLKQWTPEEDNWHLARMQLGFRLMLR